jgi:hypothetical protein
MGKTKIGGQEDDHEDGDSGGEVSRQAQNVVVRTIGLRIKVGGSGKENAQTQRDPVSRRCPVAAIKLVSESPRRRKVKNTPARRVPSSMVWAS